jgi:hypothetical protein
MKVTALLLALLLATPALAQSGRHDDAHMELHEYYKNLRVPSVPDSAPGSCCNMRVILPDGTVVGDCRPVRAWLDDYGVWHAIDDGEEILIPDSSIIGGDQPVAPDGNSHLCRSTAGTIYCFVAGQPKI